MSEAKKCDRCGKLYEKYDTYEDNGIIFTCGDNEEGGTGDKIDLCPDCMKELKNWIENPNKICEDKELYERIRYFKKWIYSGKI